jgi:hypothetical protein
MIRSVMHGKYMGLRKDCPYWSLESSVGPKLELPVTVEPVR